MSSLLLLSTRIPSVFYYALLVNLSFLPAEETCYRDLEISLWIQNEATNMQTCE